jgi:CRP-like cAMP-binding protein
VFRKAASSSVAHSSELSRTYADHQMICREGDSSAEMFVIQSGSVRVFKTLDGGELELAVLGKGEFFGEMSVLESLPRDASAQAVGEAEVLVMTPGALLVRLRRDPTFAFELLRRLSGRVRALNARLIEALGANPERVNGGGPEAMLYQPDGVEAGGPARDH